MWLQVQVLSFRFRWQREAVSGKPHKLASAGPTPASASLCMTIVHEIHNASVGIFDKREKDKAMKHRISNAITHELREVAQR